MFFSKRKYTKINYLTRILQTGLYDTISRVFTDGCPRLLIHRLLMNDQSGNIHKYVVSQSAKPVALNDVPLPSA